ncbi:MAG: hypothetical protein IJV22_10230 [Bacteroidales bacterium]|nr:hypothetical protein [Bacteroidales bacterium]MBQ9639915.1 hypothetical protein [Bacteroidales bacterium]
METAKTDILIHQGLGALRFGMPVEQVVELWGEADSVESIDNLANEPTTVLHYDQLQTSLFFENENPELQCVDVANPDCTLFGLEVFPLTERDLVKIMTDHGFFEEDVEQEPWGERRVSFPEANIDFYFDAGKLCTITFGQ